METTKAKPRPSDKLPETEYHDAVSSIHPTDDIWFHIRKIRYTSPKVRTYDYKPPAGGSPIPTSIPTPPRVPTTPPYPPIDPHDIHGGYPGFVDPSTGKLPAVPEEEDIERMKKEAEKPKDYAVLVGVTAAISLVALMTLASWASPVPGDEVLMTPLSIMSFANAPELLATATTAAAGSTGAGAAYTAFLSAFGGCVGVFGLLPDLTH